MSSVNTAQAACWRCQSINVYDGPTCEICGANFKPTTPPIYSVPTVAYPRQSTPVATGGSIQVRAGTHPMVLVVILSLLFGGWTGMLVNRQYAKAIVFGLIAGIVVGVFTFGIGTIIWYPLTIIDAILVANKLNQGQAIKEWEFF